MAGSCDGVVSSSTLHVAARLSSGRSGATYLYSFMGRSMEARVLHDGLFADDPDTLNVREVEPIHPADPFSTEGIAIDCSIRE
jgi:hypothetical protein